ncbi:FRG domain-containing protein [Stenotrophomonas indicatrix]|uniref:FRG domain-containing protein n=1 Tax=Stenotrophomonas indicatrix TaxID=2045451 RepID=UPI0034401562
MTKTFRCETVEELKAAISEVGPDALYRGQNQHYTHPDGATSLVTSFSRSTCIPNLMIKWSHYAKRLLRRHVQGWGDRKDLATDQAILQHYGWRSFFLDATGDAKVAAWFASHKFVPRPHGELVEDCHEDPVVLISDLAEFIPAEGDGHLYLISKKACRSAGIGCVHLSEIATKEGRPRYVCQDAYMVGHLEPSGLPESVLLAHLVVPVAVLLSYANGLSTEDLFPEPEVDPVFSDLLEMPWVRVGPEDDSIPFFKRSLPLPEYKLHVRKHMPPTAAMYRPFWLGDLRDPADPERLTHILCGAGIYHGTSSKPSSLPLLTQILESCDGLVVEVDGLVYFGGRGRYVKGVMVKKVEQDLIAVSEIGVEHPGLQIQNIGVFQGWHFRVKADGVWLREAHEDDCDCGSDEHDEQLKLLGRVEECLADGSIEPHSSGFYVERGVRRASDRSLMREFYASQAAAES